MTVADHIDPHRGDRVKFFDPANLQCLCKACHDGAKQREDKQVL
jgi:5-methylcytosine-specific restriction endonuclease McrA